METVMQSTLLDRSTILLTASAVVLSVLWWMSTRRPKGLPPGPGLALPLLGHLHLMEKDPRPKFREWREKYGDVFSLYIGQRLVVVLNGFSAINEALVKTADAFSDRPHMFFTEIAKDRGIVFSSGAVWKEQRKVGVEILRKMGMGKDSLAGKIQEEVAHYIQNVTQHQGAPIDLKWITHVSVANNICSIIFGRRYNYDAPAFLSFIEAVSVIANKIEGGALVSFFPMLAKLPGDLFGSKDIVAANRRLEEEFLQPLIEEHKKTMYDNEDDDFIREYLHKMKALRDSSKVTTLDDSNLLRSIWDLFGAGTETTASTIQWAMIHFLYHPEVQDKCYKEICDVIGTQRLPCIQDRPKMTYVEATINEVQRISPVAPCSIQHGVTHDVRFRDYVIPKATIVFPILESALMDPETWGDPDNFRPERFVGYDGKLTKPEEFIPFGIGRRTCPGELLGRMELFLYITSLIQNFQLIPEDPDHLPSLEGVFGITNAPRPFKIRAVPRKQMSSQRYSTNTNH